MGSGKNSKGYVRQLTKKTSLSEKSKVLHIFSFDIAKIPNISPNPLNIIAIRRKITMTLTAVNNDIGK